MLKWMMVLGFGFCMAQANAEEAQVLKTQRDIQSYGIGVNIAKSFKRDDVDIDMDLLVKGMKDVMAGEKLLMPERDMRRAMNSLQGDLRQKAAARHRIAAEDNRKKGEAFLAENKTRKGVVTLASGVQYKIIKAGDGRKPMDSDMVECNYRGTLLDGTEFDTTDPGKPATLKVSQLIDGWKEALKLMPAGSKWQIFIPSQLAYGPRGVGSDIGPNETLVFEVELLSVK
ncbi:outer membrane protein MIP [Ferrigenium kumadai]|uniref:Peptidyl-prolyl cis-trans isomerase n=2 Tax=Ferrigenium kumadai TaxID=1682490 RepID=A0AAN1SZ88_9PROT|nr:outer membrane protein MIP [Ferrigenium kumadai]